MREPPLRIIAAKGEYEPCSFVLVADRNMGKVKLEISDLKRDEGRGMGDEVFPKEKLDLKTVKVWYQCGNAWTSYFADPKLRLIPELLLNDEDLVKVDTEKGWNYARLTETDGRVHYRWLNPPAGSGERDEGRFFCMKPNFCDAKTHQGAMLKKGEYKQFFLTANVGKEVKAGLYRGEVKIKSKAKGEGEQWKIPVFLRVLDFELPKPKCYFDIEKDFIVWFCEYLGVSYYQGLNGNDRELAKKQLLATLKDFVRHNEITPNYNNAWDDYEIGKEAGMIFDSALHAGGMYLGEAAEMRYRARRKKEELTKKFGWHPFLLYWGDEFGLATLRGVRDMVEIYEAEGFRWPVNSYYGYAAAGYLSDLWWPPSWPGKKSTEKVAKFNQLGGDGYFGWYACHHVGTENPAFCRRQYGFGPYRAGFSSDFNYAHCPAEWNDLRNMYRSMAFVYATGDGVVDTIAWEGFREGIDDIRYATKLKQLALPLVKSADVRKKYAAKKALQLLADADGDNMDLTTLRLEMIRHIQRLMALK